MKLAKISKDFSCLSAAKKKKKKEKKIVGQIK